MLGGILLYILIVCVGFILLIVPGVIFAYKYSLFALLIIDKGMGPIDALKESGRLTDGAKWDLYTFNKFTQFISFLGILCFVVGLLLAMPVIIAASMDAYLQLVKRNGK